MQRSREEKRLLGDKVIAFAVMIQSLLLVMQTVMIGVFKMDADATTVYRVLLTAVPMILAIIVAYRRNSGRFVIVYGIAVIVLLLTCVLFPQNEPFVIGQGLRFLLPVVIPSALCLFSVGDIQVVERTLYKVSWLTVLLVLFYVIEYFRGVFVVSGYNMPFSYACLLPMVSLYSHKKPIAIIASFIVFLSVLAIGARGAAVCFLVYVFFDLFQQKSKWRVVIVALGILLFVSLPMLNEWFSSIGIRSRTLTMALEGDFASDSGRRYIQNAMFIELLNHPFLGLGLFGDRIIDVYCHNILLEICIDFGLLFGPMIIIYLLYKVIHIYIQADGENRNRLTRYFCALILPFMTSGSYLIGGEFAIFVGICYLIKKDNKQKNVILAQR